MDENEISRIIIGAAIDVHATLGGPGLLESVYEQALACELTQRGLLFERQLLVPIMYKRMKQATPLRLDLLVERAVVVECKATSQHFVIYDVQTLTYLRTSKLRLGLVINSGGRYLSQGVRRIVDNL